MDGWSVGGKIESVHVCVYISNVYVFVFILFNLYDS